MASVPELERILIGVVAGSLVAAAIVFALGWAQGASFDGPTVMDGFPRSFWISELLVSLAVLGGVRFAIRAATEREHRPGSSLANVRRTLLYGAGRTGVLMARSAERNPEPASCPVGFLDDDPARRQVRGLRVFGARGDQARRPADRRPNAADHDAPRRRGPSVAWWMRPWPWGSKSGPSRRSPISSTAASRAPDASVRVEDLLRRPIVTDHVDGVREIMRPRRSSITGAAGSIGSELARQVYALGPRRLILVDRAESPLYLLERELETRRPWLGAAKVRSPWPTSPTVRPWTGSSPWKRPSVIFHAAAYKHVPMMEAHPSDAMFVNVSGTQAVLDAARRRCRTVRPRLDRQGRPAIERHGREQAGRRDARRRHRPSDRPAVRLRALRQRPRIERQRRADLPGAARERRAADRHGSGHDPLLHDHPGGGLADPRCRGPGPDGRLVRARHG